MPLLWRIPDDYPESQIGFWDRDSGPDRFDLLEGCRLSEPLATRAKAQFDCKRVGLCRSDCIWTDARIPIVSEKIKTFLSERISGQVQFFEIDVSANDGDVPGYFLLNATNTVGVIDLGASKFSFISGTKEVMSFSVLRTIAGAMDDVSIGRDRIYLPYLFVGRALAAEFGEAGFSGMSLVEPNSVG